MVICFFSAQYLPTVGGVERYTYNLARKMCESGHRSIVVTSALPGLPDHETDAAGIEIFRLPVFPFMNGRFPVLKPSSALTRQLRLVWDQKPDICLVNTRFYTSSLYAARACSKRDIPAFIVEHSTGHLKMGNPILDFAGQCYEHLACRWIYHYCPHFYGVSAAVCRWLKHFHVKAEGTLYNAVSPEDFTADPQARDWHRYLGLSEDVRLVSYVGRIIPEKGAGDLMEAFHQAAIPDTALVIAGDGPQLEQLKGRKLPNVFFPGNVKHSDIISLLLQSRLYCLPTRYAEGFPTTSLEAAACGCPILTTFTGGSEELLPDDTYGIQLQADYTVKDLSSALQRILSDPGYCSAASQKLRTRLMENFTWDASARRLLSICNLLRGETNAETVDRDPRL